MKRFPEVFDKKYYKQSIAFQIDLLKNPNHRGNSDERIIRWIINEFRESNDKENARHRKPLFSLPEDISGNQGAQGQETRDTDWN